MYDSESPECLADELISVVASAAKWEEALEMIQDIKKCEEGISDVAMQSLKKAHQALLKGALRGDAAKVKAELEALGVGSGSARAANDWGEKSDRRARRAALSIGTASSTSNLSRLSKADSATGSFQSRAEGYSTLLGVLTVRDL